MFTWFQMLLSKIEGTTPRLLDLTTLPELNDDTGETHSRLTSYCFYSLLVR